MSWNSKKTERHRVGVGDGGTIEIFEVNTSNDVPKYLIRIRVQGSWIRGEGGEVRDLGNTNSSMKN